MSSTRRYRLRPPRRLATPWHAAVVALLLLAFGASPSAAGASGGGGGPQVNIVSKGHPAGAHYFKTIQAAVNASKSGDWVLIEPGTYYEEVRVTEKQSGIWIRGMDRNKVVIDGQHKVGNGIFIYKANNVWVENLTVHDFEYGEECPDESCGNEIWWSGDPQSSKIGAHGWYGSYLTAYDTGLQGGYGLFASHEQTGSWENIYASGFADSGIYIGACQECDARVSGAIMEKNALGYSGSNAGGKLVLENSIYRQNNVGIAPNSEVPGDKPPPQDGECGRPNIENPNPEPIITTTEIPRCTIIRHNLIVNNGDLTLPFNGSTAIAPWGAGVELAGDYADLVTENVISGNASDGVLGFEYPNPTNLEALEKGEYPFFPDTLYFQLAGNAITSNVFAKNGSGTKQAGPFKGDISLMGGFSEFFNSLGIPYPQSHSENDCASGNLLSTSFPANIQGTWGCQNAKTPSVGGGGAAINYLGGLIAEAGEARAINPPVGQPAPPRQPTMPNPCAGVPKNPLCN